ncbi:ACT domain-containing protein [Thermogladius sp. 4427co]|uniref:ACT domain-containing protein n=1 Tax=Thermogladius sp. 4427co TaxID=3450718 RepID=UPI003F793D5C
MATSSRETSISKIVEKIVENDPILRECIASGIVNYSSIARMIKPIVDREVGSDVSVQSIKVALIRLASRINPLDTTRIEKILADTSIEVKTKVSIITYDSTLYKDVIRLSSGINSARFLSIVTGITNVTVIISEEQVKTFLDNIQAKPLLYLDNLTALVLVSPVENIYTPGFIAYVTTVLAQAGINIIQVTSSYSETVIIVSSEDTLKAFTLLNELIARARKKLYVVK